MSNCVSVRVVVWCFRVVRVMSVSLGWIGVPPRRINEIVQGKRRITVDTAIRLARFFGTSEELWMNVQSNYDLRFTR